MNSEQNKYLNQQLVFPFQLHSKAPFQIIQLSQSKNAHNSYFIESNGQAMVIDPLRDINNILNLQCQTDSKIKYIVLTHIPSDYVSGHYDLSLQTGAQIMVGPGVKAQFNVQNLADQQLIQLGSIHLQVIYTPGHTQESISLLLNDQSKKPYCIFTGDTLLIGDTGKPDANQQSDINLANKQLYASLQKLIKLPADIILYPTHSQNHHCGPKVKEQRVSSTLKEAIELAPNIKLSENDFIAQVKPQPGFPYMKELVQINLQKVAKFNDLLSQCLIPLSLQEFESKKKTTFVLDTRKKEHFMEESIPGTISVNIYTMNSELWAPRMVPPKQKILLITEPNNELEAVTRLLRIGIDQIQGFLIGGIETWKSKNPIIKGQYIQANTLKDDDLKGKFIIDVRNPPEFAEGHIIGAASHPLPQLEESLKKNNNLFPRDQDIQVICLGGDRATISTSILRNFGYTRIINYMGGYESIKEKNNLTIVK